MVNPIPTPVENTIDQAPQLVLVDNGLKVEIEREIYAKFGVYKQGELIGQIAVPLLATLQSYGLSGEFKMEVRPG